MPHSWDGTSPRAFGEADAKRVDQVVVWKRQWQLRMERRIKTTMVMTGAEIVILGLILAKMFNWL